MLLENEDPIKLNEVCQLLAQVNLDNSEDGNAAGDRLLEVIDGSEDEMSPVASSSSLAPTEPTDSPFRVRRYSLLQEPDGASVVKCSISNVSEDVPPTPISHKKSSSNASSISGSTHFFLLRRSRSVDHIDGDESDKEEGSLSGEPIKKTVEALEIEIFPNESDEFAKPEMMERPQTSPPTVPCMASGDLLASKPSIKNMTPSRASTPGSRGTKMMSGVLGRMQKSINFLFRCATRRGSTDSTSDEAATPRRSATPEASKSTKQFASSGRKPLAGDSASVPMADIKVALGGKQVDGTSFITQVSKAPVSHAYSGHYQHAHVFDVPVPKAPLLKFVAPPDHGKKCLVLDLDETLVHSTFVVPEAYDLIVPLILPDGSYQNIYVAKRPGVDGFLRDMCEMFEVVIFTASLSRYADPVIDFLTEGMWAHGATKSPTGAPSIRHRLYRESCLFLQGLYVKDLSRLGRDLEHTVIVDNSPASFLLQPDNGIPIRSWFDDPMDAELMRLAESLRLLATSESVHAWRLHHQHKYVFP